MHKCLSAQWKDQNIIFYYFYALTANVNVQCFEVEIAYMAFFILKICGNFLGGFKLKTPQCFSRSWENTQPNDDMYGLERTPFLECSLGSLALFMAGQLVGLEAGQALLSELRWAHAHQGVPGRQGGLGLPHPSHQGGNVTVTLPHVVMEVQLV